MVLLLQHYLIAIRPVLRTTLPNSDMREEKWAYWTAKIVFGGRWWSFWGWLSYRWWSWPTFWEWSQSWFICRFNGVHWLLRSCLKSYLWCLRCSAEFCWAVYWRQSLQESKQRIIHEFLRPFQPPQLLRQKLIDGSLFLRSLCLSDLQCGFELPCDGGEDLGMNDARKRSRS